MKLFLFVLFAVSCQWNKRIILFGQIPKALQAFGICLFFFAAPQICTAQAEDEIQVYSSPTIQKGGTIFELHNNFMLNGVQGIKNPKSVRWLKETLEITHGFADNFEIGLYTLTGIAPDGHFQYLGNRIRPRVTLPEKFKWPVGASLSVEFGFARDSATLPWYWGGEIRPIFDKTVGNWYFSFNPNIAFILTGYDKVWAFTPQVKTVYTIQQKVGVGVEYYSDLGPFNHFLPGAQQEHLLGPVIDLYLHPKWEVNTGALFGLTPGSSRTTFKLILGRRIGK